MRACEKSGHYISKHYRLFEPFEQQGSNSSEYEYESKVTDKTFYIKCLGDSLDVSQYHVKHRFH